MVIVWIENEVYTKVYNNDERRTFIDVRSDYNLFYCSHKDTYHQDA